MTFNPNRLSLARERRQLTKKELAERAGVSQVTLTRIETGQTQDPEDATVAALAAALAYPKEFFFLDDFEKLETEAVSFRSLSSMTSRQKNAAISAGVLGYSLCEWVATRFDLPVPDIPNFRNEDPASAAMALRRHWGIGSKPVPHMIRLLEAKGVRVFSLSEGKNVDAFSYWRDGVPYVFLNNAKSSERSRFDAAHELGHLVLHAHGSPQGREAEREADQFASHFLIPRDDLIASLPHVRTLDQLIASKQRWGVSLAALARSASDCGLVSEWHYRELCKQISRKGYRTREPASRPRESSVLWQKVFQALWQERVTKTMVAAELKFPADELDALLRDVLDGSPAPVESGPTRPVLKVV